MRLQLNCGTSDCLVGDREGERERGCSKGRKEGVGASSSFFGNDRFGECCGCSRPESASLANLMREYFEAKKSNLIKI